MPADFKKKYNELIGFLSGLNPEDVDWFFPELSKLLKAYDAKTVLDFVKNDATPIYTLELMVKSGFREINKDYLISFTKDNDEDDVYGAALCLAICGHEEGFVILNSFAKGTHKLKKFIDPLKDILPDLNFIEDSRVQITRKIIQNANQL